MCASGVALEALNSGDGFAAWRNRHKIFEGDAVRRRSSGAAASQGRNRNRGYNSEAGTLDMILAGPRLRFV
jgi:hypothetical protein